MGHAASPGCLSHHPAALESKEVPKPYGTLLTSGVGAEQCGGAISSKSAPEYRLRFFNFNMGNSSNFASVGDLQGPGGRGLFATALWEPLADGRPVDAVFATLVETRLSLSDWVEDYLGRKSSGCEQQLDRLLQQNARREGAQNTKSSIRSLMESLAASYNGNLKSLLAFGSTRFNEVPEAVLFGRLTEATVGRIPVPNPKKAFMGRTLVDAEQGIRLCFVGAHFPVAKLAAALEDPVGDPLHNAKIALAQTLRKVLRKAARRGLADQRTVLFVQGDLNSRTVLRNNEACDVLLELLQDDSMQAAIQNELELPPGRFYELVAHDSVDTLPVTYKFSETIGHINGAAANLTLGDVLSTANLSTADTGFAFDRAASVPASALELDAPEPIGQRQRAYSCDSRMLEGSRHPVGADLYRRTLVELGDEQLTRWGVVFKKAEFRPFRFPASADRVVYWASADLHPRLAWEFPRGGYEVNHAQLGSDHRPVALEVVMKLLPPKAVDSSTVLPSTFEAALPAPHRCFAAPPSSPNTAACLCASAKHRPGAAPGVARQGLPLRLEDSDTGDWSESDLNIGVGVECDYESPISPHKSLSRRPWSSPSSSPVLQVHL